MTHLRIDLSALEYGDLLAANERIAKERDEAIMLASNWKNAYSQVAQALLTIAQDERLDPETRLAIRRTVVTARTAHGLTDPTEESHA